MGLLLMLWFQLQREPWECPAPRERGYICNAEAYCKAHENVCGVSL
jgi:hypothetical protein